VHIYQLQNIKKNVLDKYKVLRNYHATINEEMNEKCKHQIVEIYESIDAAMLVIKEHPEKSVEMIDLIKLLQLQRSYYESKHLYYVAYVLPKKYQRKEKIEEEEVESEYKLNIAHQQNTQEKEEINPSISQDIRRLCTS